MAEIACAACADAVRPDAVAACLFAEATVVSATHLVDVNLLAEPDGERRTRASELRAECEGTRERVLEAGSVQP